MSKIEERWQFSLNRGWQFDRVKEMIRAELGESLTEQVDAREVEAGLVELNLPVGATGRVRAVIREVLPLQPFKQTHTLVEGKLLKIDYRTKLF